MITCLRPPLLPDMRPPTRAEVSTLCGKGVKIGFAADFGILSGLKADGADRWDDTDLAELTGVRSRLADKNPNLLGSAVFTFKFEVGLFASLLSVF